MVSRVRIAVQPFELVQRNLLAIHSKDHALTVNDAGDRDLGQAFLEQFNCPFVAR